MRKKDKHSKKYIKKNTKKTKKTKKPVKKINKPQVASKILLGSNESVGKNLISNYHYQSYNNMYRFFNYLIKSDSNIRAQLCLYPINYSMISIDEKKEDLIQTYVYNPSNLVERINSCKKRFIYIIVNILQEGDISHATIILIDKKEKNMEYFDPEYKKMGKNIPNKLKLFQSRFFKDLKLIIVTEKTNSVFQDKIDEYNGMCVTWCILYVHFRIINSKLPFNVVLKEISKYTTKDVLLKYGKLISRVVKGYVKKNITAI